MNLSLSFYRRLILVVVSLGIAGFAVYSNAIPHPFVHDDVVFIQNNPHLDRWDNLPQIFLPFPNPIEQSIVNPYYRPLLEILYKVEYFFFGLDPRGYHFFNVLLHVLNSALIFILLTLLGGLSALSVAASFLFLTHPVQTEAVACISGVSNLFFSFLGLISLICYVLALKKYESQRSFVFYIFSLFFFIAALLAKEQAIILFLLAILVNVSFPIPGDKKVLRKYLRIIGFSLIVFGYLLWRHMVLGQATANVLWGDPESRLRLLAIPKILLTQLGLVFYPTGLHYYRSVDILGSSGVFWMSLTILVLAAGLIVYNLPQEDRRMAVFGIAWFFLGLVPTLNIVPLVNEYSFVLAAEHFLYLAILGALLFALTVLNYVIRTFFREKGKIVFPLVLAPVVLIFMHTAYQQNDYWSAEIPLFQKMVKYEPNFGRGHILLAKAYYFNRQYDEAIIEFNKAREIMERYSFLSQKKAAYKVYQGFLKGIDFDLAHCFEAKGSTIDAVVAYTRALTIDPNDAVLHNNLGVGYMRLNDFDFAQEQFEKALELNPQQLMSATNLAICQIQKGKPFEAERLLRWVLEKDSQFVPAKTNLEKLLKEGRK